MQYNLKWGHILTLSDDVWIVNITSSSYSQFSSDRIRPLENKAKKDIFSVELNSKVMLFYSTW